MIPTKYEALQEFVIAMALMQDCGRQIAALDRWSIDSDLSMKAMEGYVQNLEVSLKHAITHLQLKILEYRIAYFGPDKKED